MGDVGEEQKGEGAMREGGGRRGWEGDWGCQCRLGWAEGPSQLWGLHDLGLSRPRGPFSNEV